VNYQGVRDRLLFQAGRLTGNSPPRHPFIIDREHQGSLARQTSAMPSYVFVLEFLRKLLPGPGAITSQVQTMDRSGRHVVNELFPLSAPIAARPQTKQESPTSLKRSEDFFNSASRSPFSTTPETDFPPS